MKTCIYDEGKEKQEGSEFASAPDRDTMIA